MLCFNCPKINFKFLKEMSIIGCKEVAIILWETNLYEEWRRNSPETFL